VGDENRAQPTLLAALAEAAQREPDVAVRSQAGDMRLAVVGGDFALSQFNSVVFDSTNHLFLLAVSGGELAVDSNLDLAAGGHSISLSASDDLLFQGALVRGVNIDVHSDAAIVGSASAGDDLQVTGLGGMLNLTSANGIGSQATPLQASLAAGVVVDAATTAAGADIFLTTPGGVPVGSFATNNGDVGLAAQAIGQLLADEATPQLVLAKAFLFGRGRRRGPLRWRLGGHGLGWQVGLEGEARCSIHQAERAEQGNQQADQGHREQVDRLQVEVEVRTVPTAPHSHEHAPNENGGHADGYGNREGEA
jgi:hypothetical protein